MRTWLRGALKGAIALAIAVLVLGACARNWVKGTADREGENCVWTGTERVAMRVVNYADPALCNRAAAGPKRLALRTEPK